METTKIIKIPTGRFLHFAELDRHKKDFLRPACGAGACLSKTPKEWQVLEMEAKNVNCPKCLHMHKYRYIAEEQKSEETSIKPIKQSEPSWVYLIKSNHNNLYKIGFTNNVEKRFLQIQSHSPVKLTLLHSIYFSNASEVEKALHETFKSYRQHGEWFQLPEKSVEWLLSWAVHLMNQAINIYYLY